MTASPRPSVSAGDRRGRRASTDVALVMIGAALVSALIVGVFNFVASRSFLLEGIENQLADVGSSQAARIENGLAALEDRTATFAIEPTVAEALVELSDAYTATDETLEPAAENALVEFYRQGIELGTPPGVQPPPTESLLPVGDTARYLQSRYVAGTPREERPGIVDPGDGSAYTAVHRRQHPVLVELADALGLGEVLLVDSDGVVVYSRSKRIDFATSLVDGPHRDSAVARAIDRLDTAAADAVILMDFESYAPALGRPEAWAVTAVRDGDEFVGAVAVAVPNDALVDITTGGGDWASLGLGDTGEAYIVGSDGLMRSESRLWLEDPDAYLAALDDAGYDQEVIDAVGSFGTTVLIQPVDTTAVAEARTGDTFEGTIDNYLGRRVRSYATPLDTGPFGWLAVTEVETSEISAPLRDYLVQLLVIALIAVPLVVVLAVSLARRILRPIDPIVAGADRIAAGDIDVTIDMAGNDEFADLARQLDLFAEELRRQRDEVDRADRETTELLESVMPPYLVEQYRAGDRAIAESIRDATLIAVSMRSSSTDPATADDLAEYVVRISAGVTEVARAVGVDQIVSSADTMIFATGLGTDSPEVGSALEFAEDVRRWADEFVRDRSVPLDVGIGVSAGDVVAGLIGTERLTFEVLGGPRQTAEGLARAAAAGEVLVDAGVAGRIPSTRAIEHVEGLRDVNGVPMEGWRLVDRDRAV